MGKATTKIFDLEGKAVGKTKVPRIFKTPLRPDVIKRAVLAEQSGRFQRQGRDPLAGKRRSFESLGSGHGMARVPRLKAGGQRAVFGVGMVGGRVAGAPVSAKKIVKKIPHKEKQLALRSAVAATGVKETVVARGHLAQEVADFPLVVVDDFEALKKTKDVENVFIKLGVWSDIYRVKESRKERAGRGKSRGRRIKHAVGPLLVISENKGIAEAAHNLLGVNVTAINKLSTELLAPGTHPGRLTVWTKSAFEKLDEIYKVGD